MENKKSNSRNLMPILIIAVAFFFFVALPIYASSVAKNNAKKSCESENKVYVESSNTCRDKTTSERFDDECITGVTVGSTHYSCSEIRQADLESAYLKNAIVKHGDALYEMGTYQEVNAGKNAGDYCLSAADTWSHVGEVRCVVFYPTYFANSGRNFFIDEKKDYQNGFVIYMYGNYNWNDFLAAYKDKGEILVCGTITTYQGHPQIKATPQNILTSPTGTARGSYTVYQYTCD